MMWCARKCARQTPGDVLKVSRAHNVVTVEHRPGLVTCHLHGYPLRHTQVDHIPDRRAPESCLSIPGTPAF